jgi:hypothetical protein
MNLSAANTGQVRLKNSDSLRTILFLADLWTLVRTLLLEQHPPGFYNAGSMSFKMGELAQSIAHTWNAEVIDEGASETYSFMLDTSKMKNVCTSNLVTHSIEHHCQTFIQQQSSRH